MRIFIYTVVFIAGGLSLASATISNTEKGSRPTDLIAADLDIPEAVFVACFEDVQPARNKNPSGARQRMNKAVLLPCLQAENPEITNLWLDQVMDRYRPEGAMKR
ncbi:hypothetical protein [Cognatishimia sp.]|uniref:hypothetical protein n=1 Tax=Cognatishimia sp. TaxID=2211648 RepID=UPI0035191EAA